MMEPNRKGKNPLAALAQASGLKVKQLAELTEELPIAHGSSLLGCGKMGCTYKREKDGVVKVTTDESEVKLWEAIVAFRKRGMRVDGVPRVWSIERLADNLWAVQRESVEPLVMGESWIMGPRTRKYLLGERLAEDLPPLRLSQATFAFDDSIEELEDDGYEIPTAVKRRVREFDDDMHKVYVATDLTEFAHLQPSRRSAWKQVYVQEMRSARKPWHLVGQTLAEILERTGDTWITDVHPGNVGWRDDRTLVVYDFMSFHMKANGKALVHYGLEA